MVTLLDRYLGAVETYLPKNTPRTDIVAEIGDDLQSQLEEREGELGRPLATNEEAAIIKAYGHPRIVAARYDGVPYLIGPALLPFYWYTLRIVLTIVIAIELIGGALAALQHDNLGTFLASVVVAWNSLIWIFGIVTIIFTVIERRPSNESPLERLGITRWDPRRLPVPGGTQPVSRVASVFSFIVNTCVLLVLLDVASARYWLLFMFAGPLAGADWHLTFTSAWIPAYVATVGGTALNAISDIATFIRPQLTQTREWTRIAASTIIIIGIALTLTHTPNFVSGSDASSTSFFNTLFLYGLIAAIAALGLQVGLSLRTLLKSRSIIRTMPEAIS